MWFYTTNRSIQSYFFLMGPENKPPAVDVGKEDCLRRVGAGRFPVDFQAEDEVSRLPYPLLSFTGLDLPHDTADSIARAIHERSPLGGGGLGSL